MTTLPAGWIQKPLAEVARLGSGGTPQARNSAYYGGDIPWAVIGDLGDGLVSATAQTITQLGLEKSSAKVVPADSILLGMYGSIGKLGIAGIAMATNQAIATVQVGDQLDVRYLFYYLLAERPKLDREGKGATQRNISQTILKPWPVRFPVDVSEQREIVDSLEDHLSRLDAADAYLDAARRRAERLLRSVLSDIYEGPMAPLSSLASGAGYGTSAKCVAAGPGPAVVRIPNLVDGAIDLTDEKRVADASVDVTSAMLEESDLLIVRTNGSVDLIGRSAVVQAGIDAAFASYLIRYRLRGDLVRPEWVQAMLSAPQSRRRIEPMAASSAGQHNLSLAKLNPLEIPVPSLDEQDKRLTRLGDAKDDVARLRSAVSSATVRRLALRRSLLSAAFSGDLTTAVRDKRADEDRMPA